MQPVQFQGVDWVHPTSSCSLSPLFPSASTLAKRQWSVFQTVLCSSPCRSVWPGMWLLWRSDSSAAADYRVASPRQWLDTPWPCCSWLVFEWSLSWAWVRLAQLLDSVSLCLSVGGGVGVGVQTHWTLIPSGFPSNLAPLQSLEWRWLLWLGMWSARTSIGLKWGAHSSFATSLSSSWHIVAVGCCTSPAFWPYEEGWARDRRKLHVPALVE